MKGGVIKQSRWRPGGVMPVAATKALKKTTMRRRISFTLTAVLLVALALSVFIQAWLLPSEVGRVVAVFPEVKPIVVPSIFWGVAAIVCWQAVALIRLRIARLVRDQGFDSSSYGWLRAMVGCLLVFVVLVAAAFIALNAMGYSTPGVMLGLIGGGLLALVAAGSLALFLWNPALGATILAELTRSPASHGRTE